MLVAPITFTAGFGMSAISRGLYETHFDLDHHLPGGASFDGHGAAWHQYPDLGPDEQSFGCYGVCDSPTQFMAHAIGQWLAASDRKFVVSFTCIRKAEQPEDGGWRWHKWGEYIGEKDPQYEYLYDECPEITEVYVYHVYECIDDSKCDDGLDEADWEARNVVSPGPSLGEMLVATGSILPDDDTP